MKEMWGLTPKEGAEFVAEVVKFFFGEWTHLHTLLLLLVCLDWVTGTTAAWIRGELRSRIGSHGIARKVGILGIVALCGLIDKALGDANYVQTAVIAFYIANELLSVIENAGKMGLPIPGILRNAVRIFEGQTTPSENPILIPEEQPAALKAEKAIEQTDKTA